MKWLSPTALALALLTTTAQAQPGARVLYEGFLVDLAEVPLDGLYDLTVEIYPSRFAREPTWSRVLLDTPIEAGAFVVQLGDDDVPLDPGVFDGPTWIGISVDDESQAGRLPLSDAPVALAARDVDGSIHPSSVWIADQEVISAEGRWVGPGAVGVTRNSDADPYPDWLEALAASDPLDPDSRPEDLDANGVADVLQGAVGPRGPSGPRGVEGIPGPLGIQGTEGRQGVEGPVGPDGPRGFRGPRGTPGPRGIQGGVGDDGREGPEGPQGPQGDEGGQGEEGPRGRPGPGNAPVGFDHLNPDVLSSLLGLSTASSDTPLEDPQSGEPVVSTIEVADQGELVQVRVTVDIEHANLRELTVTLRSPAGTEVTLHAEEAGENLELTYPDDAEPSQGNMNDFIGEEGSGEWQLSLSDVTIGTIGTLRSWTVEVTHKSLDQLSVLGDLDVHENPMMGVADGVEETDLVNRRQVDAAIDALRDELLERSASGAVYRWNTFETHSGNWGWVMGNRDDLHGGINPSQWTDGSAQANQMSADKDVLRALFVRRGYAGRNGNLVSTSYEEASSTNGRVAVVLFRIRNDTDQQIVWNPRFYYTCYGGWSERASLALNGQDSWNSGGQNCNVSQTASVNLNIPPDRTSTAIFVSTTTQPWNERRAVLLAFYDNSLDLPDGLTFVDDLDRAEGGWDQ